jgi:hypothetical protein
VKAYLARRHNAAESKQEKNFAAKNAMGAKKSGFAGGEVETDLRVLLLAVSPGQKKEKI